MPERQSIALVTGASRGIGAAAAIELARLGARVVITARTQGGLEETDDAIRAARRRGDDAAAGPAGGGQIDAIGPTLFQRFGRLDILVHNAGALGRLTPVAHILPDDWADVVAVNLSASWRLIRTCDPLLRQAAGGAGGVRDRKPSAGAAGVLGGDGGDEGGDGAPGADLGAGSRDDAVAGEPVRSGAGGDADAGERVPGGGSVDAACT